MNIYNQVLDIDLEYYGLVCFKDDIDYCKQQLSKLSEPQRHLVSNKYTVKYNEILKKGEIKSEGQARHTCNQFLMNFKDKFNDLVSGKMHKPPTM